MGCNVSHPTSDGAGIEEMGSPAPPAPRHEPRFWRAVDVTRLPHSWCCAEDAAAAQLGIAHYEDQRRFYDNVWAGVYNASASDSDGACGRERRGRRSSSRSVSGFSTHAAGWKGGAGSAAMSSVEREEFLRAAFRWLEGALIAAEAHPRIRAGAKALLGVQAFGRHLDLVDAVAPFAAGSSNPIRRGRRGPGNNHVSGSECGYREQCTTLFDRLQARSHTRLRELAQPSQLWVWQHQQQRQSYDEPQRAEQRRLQQLHISAATVRLLRQAERDFSRLSSCGRGAGMLTQHVCAHLLERRMRSLCVSMGNEGHGPHLTSPALTLREGDGISRDAMNVQLCPTGDSSAGSRSRYGSTNVHCTIAVSCPSHDVLCSCIGALNASEDFELLQMQSTVAAKAAETFDVTDQFRTTIATYVFSPRATWAQLREDTHARKSWQSRMQYHQDGRGCQRMLIGGVAEKEDTWRRWDCAVAAMGGRRVAAVAEVTWLLAPYAEIRKGIEIWSKISEAQNADELCFQFGMDASRGLM